jgi:methionyl-tRNA synthetase
MGVIHRHLSTQSPKPHYTTTPIFYVNGAPHIGHLHSVVLADVFSRWAEWRNKGWSVPPEDPEIIAGTSPILATGTDEHGIKIQKAAESQGISPRELCDKFSDKFRALAEAAGARDFRFIRTTDADHIEAVKELWKQLEQRDYIYKSTHEGWYAVSDEAFYTASQIVASKEDSNVMLSVETGSVVEWSSEETYKFKLSSFQQPILDWLESHPEAIVPSSRRDDLVEEVKQGLSDLSISRPKSRLQWGIAVPSDEEHVIYVWLDALTNYLTVAGYPWKNKKDMGCWPSDVQIIGKDIIRFHAVYFPAMLMALELPLPKHLVTHGHWTVQRAKMSKSRGNVTDPHATMEQHGRDEMRWFLCRLGGNHASDSGESIAIKRFGVCCRLTCQFQTGVQRRSKSINRSIWQGNGAII